jgi:hypothetical protein
MEAGLLTPNTSVRGPVADGCRSSEGKTEAAGVGVASSGWRHHAGELPVAGFEKLKFPS